MPYTGSDYAHAGKTDALTAIGVMLVFGGITFVLWLGARQVLSGSMSGGQLAQFLLYAAFVGTSAAALTEMWGEI